MSTVIHGFEMQREEAIPEINATARIFHHHATGAELLALETADENKTFGVTFRTLPQDHTGVAHILEHVVLGGSKKYPVKEPFQELIKGSLATFINAMTYPDQTVYPVASQNVQDLYNLMDVYLDAVFHPRLARHSLDQEGWHYELEDIDAPLVYRGIVYNEMKGQYANTDYTLMRESLYALFPDTIYGLHSGGYPRHIPDLTYEQFVEFYETHYHPANARFFLSGDLPLDESLRRIDEVIAPFGKAPHSAAVPLQARFGAPTQVEVAYAAGETNEDKAYVTVQWLLDERVDPVQVMAITMLNEVLLGSPAAPLRKALMDSDLGEDLAGLPDWGTRQMIFSTGLKGVALDDVDKVQPLILETLAGLVDEGIDPNTVEAAINTVEFALRENSAYGGQRGIGMMLNALTTWLHEGDPLAMLFFEAPLSELKARIAASPRYFEEMIQHDLLDNAHRATVIMKPDTGLRQRQDAEEEARLAQARAAMSAADLQAIVENTQTLRQLQDETNSPEALATLPVLTRDDLVREINTIPCAVEEIDGTPVLVHPLDTNGIVYLDLGFDMRVLPQDLLPSMALFGRALLEMGTEREDFVKLSQRIGRSTGGIDADTLISAARNAQPGPAWFFLRGKATGDKTDELLAILRDVLLTVNLDNRGRFRQMVSEEKARSESSLIGQGHLVVNRRLGAHFTEESWVDEEINSLSSIFFLRRLAQDVENDWPGVLQKLERIRSLLINRAALLANVTLGADQWPHFRGQLGDFLGQLPAQPVNRVAWQMPTLPTNEGLTIPAQVNYVGKGANLYAHGYALHGSALVVNHYLSNTWLFDKIRAQGGAYGGFSLFNRLSGVFTYISYRDPDLEGTLRNYDGAVDFLRGLDLSHDELTKGIIGVVGRLEPYELPDARGFTSLRRYLIGEDDEYRQQLRDEVLSTTQADFKTFADVLEVVRREGHVVVLGAGERLRALNEAQGGDWMAITQVL